MKTLKNYTLVLSATVFFLTTAGVYAYPPDNAAVVYYQAAVLYQVDDEMANVLGDFSRGDIELNDKIREFVRKNHRIVDTVLNASEIKNCDWGLDFSQGLEMEMPHISQMRKLAHLVIADTKTLTKDGNYNAAISRCVSLYKMARHINDRIYISYLMSIAVNTLTNKCIMQIMGNMPQDMQNLAALKSQLLTIDSMPLLVKPAILGEGDEVVQVFMTKEQLPEIAKLCEDKSIKAKILSLDEVAISRNRTYFENYYADVITAFDMPYLQGDAAFRDLEKKVQEDINDNPDAILTAVLTPSTNKIFSLTTRFRTHNNAIKTAMELYMIKAKTGKLPDELPAGLAGDMFSDKPFIYEKTAEGFILRCRGKDLSNNETYEYKFKIK